MLHLFSLIIKSWLWHKKETITTTQNLRSKSHSVHHVCVLLPKNLVGKAKAKNFPYYAIFCHHKNYECIWRIASSYFMERNQSKVLQIYNRYICIAQATWSVFLYQIEVSLHLLFIVIYLRASRVFDEMCRKFVYFVLCIEC